MSGQRLVIIGTGIAGLYAALVASEAGADVMLLTKGGLRDSNTWFAQGGISAVLGEPAPGDTVAAHISDTLRAGAGHCNEQAVRLMCTEARQDISALERFGVRFDTGSGGGPALGLEAAHSAPRILHAGGDATGSGVAGALIKAVLERQAAGAITLMANSQATALRKQDGRVSGVEVLQDGRRRTLTGAVLLATGGAGQMFAQTTNPAVATADGLALAVRAGAVVADLEFFQFHPTCLVIGTAPASGGNPLLISEAVRGEGAILVDGNGTRFMPAYHRDGELAPRDVVSRSIALHLAKLGDTNGSVYLDARIIERRKGPGFLARRFPTLTRGTREAGIDWTRELVPVAPAAHYWMGGVATDLHGRTSVPGLYAAGEVACTGVQGANRLASNSLLEGLVFGRRAVEAFLSGDHCWASAGPVPPPTAAGGLPLTLASGTSLADHGADEPFSRDALRRLMTAKAGVLRNGLLLREAAATLDRWAGVELSRPAADGGDADAEASHEDRNLLLAAQLLVAAALDRRESLGAHYRSGEQAQPMSLPKVSVLHD